MWRDDHVLTPPGPVGAGLAKFEDGVEARRQDGEANHHAREGAPGRARPAVPGGAWTFPMWILSHVSKPLRRGRRPRKNEGPPHSLGKALFYGQRRRSPGRLPGTP